MLGFLTVTASAGFAQDSNVEVVYVFSGTVDSVSNLGVATGIEIGDERGYSIGFNFGQAGVIDQELAEAFDIISSFPTFLGGFYADLVAGSVLGAAESSCFLGLPLATPSNGEGNGGFTLDGTTLMFLGYANDFISIGVDSGVGLGDADQWSVGDQIVVDENICNYEGQGTLFISSTVTLEQIIATPGGDFPDGSGDIVGRVTDASTLLPPACAVVVASIDGTVKAASAIDSNGDYFLRNLRTSSDYELQVHAPGYAVATEGVQIADSRGAVANISLTSDTAPDGTTITGFVTGQGRNELDEIVTSNRLGGVLVEAFDIGGTRIAFTYSCGDGTYELRGLPFAKQTVLQVRTSGSGYPIEESEVTVGTEHDPVIIKQLLPGLINGVVTDAGGSALGSVDVSVQGLTSTIQLFGKTAEDGLFTTGNLANGEYEVRVSKLAFVAESDNAIVASAPVEKNFAMDSGDTPPPSLEEEDKGACGASWGYGANASGSGLGDMIAVLVALTLLVGVSRARKVTAFRR
jgi:hypothetical protein